MTRKDIAKLAGVSISVVSRALNNSGYVEASKREEILRIAEEVGYRRNPVAVSLMKNRTHQILFVCKDLKNAFNIEVYEGLLESANEKGYRIILSGDLDFTHLRDAMVDGVVFPNEVMAYSYLETVGKNYFLPVVTASYGRLLSFPRSIPRIDSDLYKGTQILMEYLRGKGHEKIAFVSPYPETHNDARITVYRDYAKDHFLKKPNPYFLGVCKASLGEDQRLFQFAEEREEYEMVIAVSENFFEKGLFAADLFEERKLDATAVLCFNDEMAMGFWKGIRRKGYRVPEDVSVAGIDAVFVRRYADAELTGLAQDAHQQGRCCFEVLLDVIEGNKFRYVTEIPVRLIEGDTVRDIRNH